MKAKRVLSTLLAGLMAVSMLAGCGADGGDTQSPESAAQTEAADSSSSEESADAGSSADGEYVDVEFWTTNAGFLPLEKDGVMYNFYKDTIGVGITQPYVEWNGGQTYLEQLNLRIASGDMPDMFMLTGGIEADLIKEGALLDLTDLLPEYAPHLWETIPEDVWDTVRSYDPSGEGRIYFMPKVINYCRHGAMIRQDWLDALGLEMPTTQEEYVEVLRAFKTQDPNGNGTADEIPTGGREEARWMDHLFAMYGIAMWEGYPQWDIYDGELTYSAVTPNMRDALEFISGLYQEGLLDSETLLNDKSAWDGKVNANVVGSFFQWVEQSYLYATDTYAALGVQPEWVVMPPISAEGYEAFNTMMPMAGAEVAVANTDDEAMIRSCLKILDSYADPAVTDILYVGPEGMWSERDSEGNLKRLPEDRANQENMVIKPVDTIATPESVENALELSKTDADAWAVDQSITNTQENQQYGKVIAGDGIPSTIYDGYDDIRNRTLYIEYASKIIIGEWPIEKFDEFVERWYETGGEQVTQAARDWYAQKNG